MISYAQSVLDEGSHDAQDVVDDPRRVPSYDRILQTLQVLPLGQEDDDRDLSETLYLGEN